MSGATTTCAAGTAAPPAGRSPTGVRRSSAPSTSSTGTSGSCPEPRSGATGAAGQLSHSSSVSLRERRGAVEWLRTPSRECVAASASASRCRSAESGGVARGHGIGISSQDVAAYSAELSWRGGGGSASISNARRRRRSIGVDVAAERGSDRAGEGRPQGGVEVAGEQDREEVHARESAAPAPAARVHHAGRGGAAAARAIRCDQPAEVGHRVARERAAARARTASGARAARPRTVAVERVRAVEPRPPSRARGARRGSG